MARGHAAGDILGDQVEVLQFLHAAGQGIAYRARLVSTGEVVFLKQLNADTMTTGGQVAVKRFQREQSIVIDSPQVPRNLGSFQEKGVFYIITEFVEGMSLEEYRLERSAPLTCDEVKRIIKEVAAILALAHAKGIIHRDIKPANIMLADDGRIMLVDWGLCGFVDGKTLSPGNDPMGTIFFMSPEHIANEGVDRQSDIFSLGSTAYVCLTNVYPFDGADEREIFRNTISSEPANPVSLNPNVDPDLAAIVLRMIEKEKTKRYPDAAALTSDLEHGFGACSSTTTCKCGAPIADSTRFCLRCGAASGVTCPPCNAVLRVLQGSVLKREVPVSPKGTDVGRYLLAPEDDFISRNHARFFHADGQFWIEDLNSLNGTSVNGLAIPPGGRHPLVPGDWIRLADTFCEFGS